MKAEPVSAPQPVCRSCSSQLQHTFVDLGMSPLCESYISAENLNGMEAFYPLHVYVCGECFLVQLEQYVTPEHIFKKYAYFSSYSDTWLQHAKDYADMITKRVSLDAHSSVVELASNDGYLLQYFVAKGIPVLGVEPAENVAAAAIEKGVPTTVKFFGERAAQEIVKEVGKADLIIGNNVLAQVPDVHDFVGGMGCLLAASGVITMEFPHLMELIDKNQFDTIYHEHFSYFSLVAVERILDAHGLRLFDVEELATHGGSLRIYVCHAADQAKSVTQRVRELRAKEESYGLYELDTYFAFAERVKETKRRLLEFLISAKRMGKAIAGYGAPGKGNTLLNYCGIRTDFIDYTVDRNPYKQGKSLPGTHIPIEAPARVAETRPDYLLILPWNFREEIIQQMSMIRSWGGQFVVPIPEIEVC
jgi:hypothetical protein